MKCRVGLSWELGILAACLLVLLSFGGCNSGGSNSSDGDVKAEGSYGKVGILLTDGPADEYSHIWVTVTEVSLIPSEKDDAVVIFSSDEGYRFDLLQYRDEDFFLKLNEEVPVGTYEKVRLKILKVEAEGGPCEEMEIKVPSGKIDLNPRSRIVVEEGATIYIRLDIDADKSINLHEAGESGKCIFRPVVFVDVMTREALPKCPTLIKGTVCGVNDKNGDGTPESFTLKRDRGCLGNIDVRINDETLIFKEDGSFGCASDLEEGQHVTVRGTVDDGCFEATLVVIGNALCLKGTVMEPVDDTAFTLAPSSGEAIAGDVTVILDERTLLFSGCNTPAEAVEADMKVLVIGKLDVTDRKFYAAVVHIKADEVSGTTGDVEKADGGYYLTINLSAGGTERIFITADTRIAIEGDGLFPEDMIEFLSLYPYHVRVIRGCGDSLELRITPESVRGEVVDICSILERTILVDTGETDCDATVRIMFLATGIDTTGESDRLVSFSDIDEGQLITCYGFWKGTGDEARFCTFVYIVKDQQCEIDEDDEDDD